MNLQLLLPKYLGTNRPEDLLIKSILIKIESKISTSWMIKVNNWNSKKKKKKMMIHLLIDDLLKLIMVDN